jgi:hypothetical protein
MNEKILNTSHCQVKTVKYKDRDYKVQSDKNGFKFIKVSENGKRIIIPLKILETNDIVFDYIFNFGFQKNKNKYLEMCALLRISLNKEFTFNTQKEKLQITEDWKEFLQIANQLNKEFKLNKLNN